MHASSIQIYSMEDDTIQYLRDLAAQPWYPAFPGDCAGDKAYFCTHTTSKY